MVDYNSSSKYYTLPSHLDFSDILSFYISEQKCPVDTPDLDDIDFYSKYNSNHPKLRPKQPQGNSKKQKC
jgi:hypothetical protein